MINVYLSHLACRQIIETVVQADKGQQVCDRPQAFFLPLDQKSPDDHDFIDLETSTETDVTDLQEALRKHRPGNINFYSEYDQHGSEVPHVILQLI